MTIHEDCQAASGLFDLRVSESGYRVVVADSRSARDSRSIETLGHYNPRKKPALVTIDRERVTHWVEKGAQVSDTVRTLLARHLTPVPAAPDVAAVKPAPGAPATA